MLADKNDVKSEATPYRASSSPSSACESFRELNPDAESAATRLSRAKGNSAKSWVCERKRSTMYRVIATFGTTILMNNADTSAAQIRVAGCNDRRFVHYDGWSPLHVQQPIRSVPLVANRTSWYSARTRTA